MADVDIKQRDAALRAEAAFLASRFCLRIQVVLEWMEARKIASALDLKKMFPGDHEQSMDAALADVWKHIREKGGLGGELARY